MNNHSSVENFSVETIDFGGLGAALKALRLPFGKSCRSEVNEVILCSVDDGNDAGIWFCNAIQGRLEVNDKTLLSTLIKRGDEHAKVLRGVVVWCEINAPLYWWKEMDTYRVGAERLSSESSMHIQGRGLSEEELLELQENMPCGTMQKRIWMFSYQTLRRIYFQRRDHRLPQWRKFCDWIKTLPFANELIICERDTNSD